MTRILACLLLSFLVVSPALRAQTPSLALRAGVDYEVLDAGQRWQTPDGRIEVVEVFAYWCHHCADFQPMVDAWKPKLGADVSFVYVPAAFDVEDPFALAYFAVEQAKAVPRLHNTIFDAIHRDGTLPRNATVDEIGTWLGQNGLKRERMVAAMRSKEVAARMTRARAFALANRVNGTPSLIVNGKYAVRGRTLQDRLRIADMLIAMERAAARKP